MSEQTTSTSSPPTRPWRRMIWFLGILVILLVVLIAAAPWIVTHTSLRDTALNRILAGPSVTASTESASLGWLSPLSVQGMQLSSTNKHVLIRVENIAAERSPWQLWSSAPDLGTINVENVHVQLELPLDIQIQESGKRLEPTFAAVVKNVALTVRKTGEEEPIIDVPDVNLSLRVEKAEKGGRVLTLDPTVLFDKAKVSPKLANRLLHLFDPTMSDNVDVGGEISLSLDKLRVPIGVSKDEAAKQIEMEGKLVLHDVSTPVSNPLSQSLVHLVADINGKDASKVVRLIQTAEVRFQVREGRLHHEGLRFGVPDIDPELQLTSRGSAASTDPLTSSWTCLASIRFSANKKARPSAASPATSASRRSASRMVPSFFASTIARTRSFTPRTSI